MTAISSEESRSRPVAVRSALARDWEKRVGGGVSAAVATLVMAVRRASRPPAISLTQSFIERGRWLTEGEDSRIFSRVPFLFLRVRETLRARFAWRACGKLRA